MSVIIACLILIVISSAYAITLRRKFAETFFLSIATVAAVIYGSGLLNFKGCLRYGLGGVVLLAALSLACCLRKTLKNRRVWAEIELVQGCLLFGLFTAFALYVGYNHHWSEGDEFSYWGIAVKHMFIFDAFTTSYADIGPITLPAYLPGTSIVHYFFSRFAAEFSEYPAYVSMNILYFSLLMPFIKSLFAKRHFINCLLLLVVYAFIPLQAIVFPPYKTLSVDYFLGFLFGVSIVYYFTYKDEESPYGRLMVSSALLLLALAKDTGLLFALVVCGIIFLDSVLFKREEIRALLRGSSIFNKLRNILFYALPVLCAALAVLSWRWHLGSNNVAANVSPPSLSDIFSLLSMNIDPKQREIAKYCYKAMFRPLPPFPYSVAGFTTLFVVVSSIFSLCKRKSVDIRRMAVCVAAIVLGFVLYETALMLALVFSFFGHYMGDSYFDIYTESFGRYTSSYIIGMQVYLIMFLLPVESSLRISYASLKEKMAVCRAKFSSDEAVAYKDIAAAAVSLEKALPAALAIILAACLIKTASPFFVPHLILVRQIFSGEYRPRPVSTVGRWRQYIADKIDGPLYVISQDPAGWWRVRMMDVGELYPRAKVFRSTSGQWLYACTIGVDIGDDLPVWPPPPARFLPDEWEQFIFANAIGYLYIDLSDPGFIDSYGRFFPYGVQDGMLYKVRKDDGRLSLVPVTELSKENEYK